ncbi:WD-repeat region-domain-containing protein [Zychaea mexicana]|uniref:WD-repeat region-domain-containing protein n=1 Tax=Zychaea mexicana TaxID=64656 RepID=UPI0022FEEF42|nr:WD-repeat region-domain-containing protein [Zychaea mexicana]KAI9495654.1 WD-repeat region-domain-containing protein [Zychaea mexicana]
MKIKKKERRTRSRFVPPILFRSRDTTCRLPLSLFHTYKLTAGIMALRRFPLMTPVDEEAKVFRGFLPVHSVEYLIQVHLPGNSAGAQVYGGAELKHMLREMDEQKLINRLNQCDEITLFLSELKAMLEEHETFKKSKNGLNFSATKRYKELMGELKQIGFDKVSHINEAMDHITFKLQDQNGRVHNVKTHIPPGYPLTPLKLILDGPSSNGSSSNSMNEGRDSNKDTTLTTTTTHSTLHAAILYYYDWIETFRDYFVCVDELDQHVRVLDPDQPTGKDAWRRVALKGHCSLHLELDPKFPRAGLKAMRFYGSEKNMKTLQQLWESQAEQWSRADTPYKNLSRIFGDRMMTKVSNSHHHQQDTSFDVECAICYAYKLEHPDLGLLTPDVICINDQCNRGFHPTCISEWLRSNPTTTRSFNILFGKCPYCSEKITTKEIL